MERKRERERKISQIAHEWLVDPSRHYDTYLIQRASLGRVYWLCHRLRTSPSQTSPKASALWLAHWIRFEEIGHLTLTDKGVTCSANLILEQDHQLAAILAAMPWKVRTTMSACIFTENNALTIRG